MSGVATLSNGPDPVLRIEELTMEFIGGPRPVRAVEDINLQLLPGTTHGIVGESGSGKSAMALSIARLLPQRLGRLVSGRIEVEGRDVTNMNEASFRPLRGKAIGFIFQDPMTSLNPTLTVGEQIAEPMRVHLGIGRKEARERAVALINKVGIRMPSARARDYPHQLSGGMRQRIMIAIAVACKPRILIADEPTTALDVTIQAQILDLILELSSETGTAVILITHDLGVAARMCDSISVMYAGRFVETGPTDAIFYSPRMPYTSGLLRATPHLGSEQNLVPIPGVPPLMTLTRAGCRFAPRCSHCHPICQESEPAVVERGSSHTARCWATEQNGWLA